MATVTTNVVTIKVDGRYWGEFALAKESTSNQTREAAWMFSGTIQNIIRAVIIPGKEVNYLTSPESPS